MVTLEPRILLNSVLGLVDLERYLARNVSAFDRSADETLKEMGDTLARDCEGLRIQGAADAAMGIKDVKSTDELKQTLAFVRNAIAIGLNRRKFFEPESQYLKYFENPKLFGDAVLTAFPSATDDIAEAGTCLALERSTACIMHLMRAAEVSLRTLAKTVGVTDPLNDWGSYLRETDRKLTEKAKAAGKRTADEEFYAEAIAQLDHVKRAWRNQSMHIDKSYSQPRAEEILLATKSLMAHLATRISE
jgi:hypothetical protein